MTRQFFLFPFLLFSLSPFYSFSQTGGRAIYEFLQLSPSARVTALGGRYISMQDTANPDVVLAQMNPAILSTHSTKSISINQSFYFGGTRFSTLSGAFHLPKENITVHAGLQYLNYGKFQGTDEFGNKTNEFNASDMALITGASKKLFDNLSIGLNLKFIFSQLETYKSSGLGIDLGALYTLKQDYQYLGLSVRHMVYNGTPFMRPVNLFLLILNWDTPGDWNMYRFNFLSQPMISSDGLCGMIIRMRKFRYLVSRSMPLRPLKGLLIMLHVT